MERQIKFRAWDIGSRSKMIYRDYNVWIDLDGVTFESPIQMNYTPNIEIQKSKNIILEQFTGLLDKNGKEIYEGDIMRVAGSNWTLEHNTQVIFSEGRFITDFFNYEIDCRAEVIGNIHLNPELLNQQKGKS